MIEAVLLDLDDTLFDHQHSARQALEAVRGRHAQLAALPAGEVERRHAELLEELHLLVLDGRLSLDDARRERFRRLLEYAGVDAGPGVQAEMVQATAECYRTRYIDAWRAVPGALALLRALRGRAKVGVVSNNLAREQWEKLRFCGFAPLVDVVVISEEAGVSKPDPRIFEIALERLETRASQAVMIGDAWRTDIDGAARAGIRAIWFNPARHPPPSGRGSVEEIHSLDPGEVLPVVFGDRWPSGSSVGERPDR